MVLGPLQGPLPATLFAAVLALDQGSVLAVALAAVLPGLDLLELREISKDLS